MALELFDYQSGILDLLRHGFAAGHRSQMLVAPTGGGKCLGHGTPVLTADGTIVPVQDVRAGDALMGPDGKPRNVLSVCTGREMLYRVTPKKGDAYVVNASHILSLRKTPGSDGLQLADGSKVQRDADIVNVNVVTFARSNATARHCLKGWRADAIDSFMRDDDDTDRLVPPYILGAWLGDGTQGRAAISKPQCKMVDEWIAYGESVGYGCRNQATDGDCPTWILTNGKDGHSFNLIQNALDLVGVLHSRHVPDAYKFAPLKVRLEVLAGLIDSDGHINHGGCDWISKSEQLASDFAFLCRSVGLACYISKQRKTIAGTDFEGWYWRASVSGDLSMLPMRDKVAPIRAQKKRQLVHGITVEPLEVGDYYGFEIDGDHLFLLGDFTVTHNTEMAISLLEAAAKRGNRAAMVLDRIVLCDQTSQRLQKYGIDHGVMQSGHWRYRPYEPIQVCSAQTLEKRGSFPGLKLLIVDEAHQTRKQTIEFIKNNPHVKVVGLSATPFTKGLGTVYSNVVSSVTTQELVNRGRLCPLRVFISKEIDMDGAKKVAGEWAQDEVTERGMKITGDIVSEWVKKTHEVFGAPRKTVVFCAGVAHGADLAQKFAEAGYNFVSLSYKDDDKYKQDAIAEFAKADSSIHGLIATDILTKGFDVSDTMIGVSARPFSKSLSSHIQQMGRVMRSHPGKEFALWLCLARGSRVLTDRGLVPIEKVSRSDKIWDGTNYVAHGGAVCNGIQNTITYQGLTATPGHLVHTAQGWRTFGECAREQIAITQTGFGGQAIRLREDHQSGRVMARGEVAPVRPRGLRVRKLWQSIRNFAIEFGRRAYQGLPSLQPASAGIPAMALRPSTGDACALPQPEGFAIPDLWRARRGVQVRGGEGRDAMDHGEPWHPSQPGMDAIGSYRPRGALRAGQHSLAHGGAQPTEQAWQSSGRAHAQVPNGTPRDSLFGQHAQAPVLERDDGGADHRAVSPTICEAEREVWDILDAGPCNRFTCEGLLVHNCHSGNYLRFRDDWDEVYEGGIHSLDDGREKAKKEPTQKEKEAAKCPKCSSLWPGNSDTCPCCGHVRLRQSLIESVPGQMEELGGTNAMREMKRKWLAELKFVCEAKAYSSGWAAHKFKEKFGSWPTNINVEPAPASLEVQRWLRSRQIAWAKSRAAA